MCPREVMPLVQKTLAEKELLICHLLCRAALWEEPQVRIPGPDMWGLTPVCDQFLHRGLWAM